MGLYSLQDPYGLSTWYDYNGAYDLWTGTDLLLDLTRHIIESDAYMFQAVAFPKGQDIFLQPGQSFSGSLNLTPYSYIVSMTGWSGNGNQFTLRIYDKGAQSDLYFRQFAWFPTVISNMTGTLNNGEVLLISTKDKPFGPYFFRDPLIVLPPGVLQVQVTNASTQPLVAGLGIIQMVLGVAVPRNTLTLQNRKVTTASDQTGLSSLLSLVGGS
jgi:hypothetical protein